MIDVGIDESQTPGNPLLVLSAVVGNTGMMRKLDAEWKRDLRVSGVDYFHATEHWNGSSKPYHGISRAEREVLLKHLIGHFHHRFLFGVSAFIDEEEYRASSSERFRSQYGSPYGFAFQLLMVTILAELTKQRRVNQPVNILIEHGHKNAEQAIGFIKAKKALNSGKGLQIGTYGLGEKKEHPILQPADMLAFGVCEYYNTGQSEFLRRLWLPKYKRRFITLPWHTSSFEAAKSDITWHIEGKKAGIPGAKRRREMVMW